MSRSSVSQAAEAPSGTQMSQKTSPLKQKVATGQDGLSRLRTWASSHGLDPKRNYVQEGYQWASKSVSKSFDLLAPLSNTKKALFFAVALLFLWLPILLALAVFLPFLLFGTLVFYATFSDLSTLYAHTDTTVQTAVGVSIPQLPNLLYGYFLKGFQQFGSLFYDYRQFVVNKLSPLVARAYDAVYDLVHRLWSFVPVTIREDLSSLYTNKVYPLGQKTNQFVTAKVQQLVAWLGNIISGFCSSVTSSKSCGAQKSQ